MNRVRWTSVLALIAGLSLVIFFAFKTWHQWTLVQRINSGEVQVETLRGWMTLPYIEKTYGVRQAEIRKALDLPESGFEERSLKDWLNLTGQDPVLGRRKVEALILQAHSAKTKRPSP
ncbi:MAG: hypothetical protein IPF65_13440 [Polaromonas sp.]|nr:hypothetical protein [Polaromonas sp.]